MLYQVVQRDRCGYINSSGNVIVPIEADSCLEFGDGLGGVFRGMNLEIVDENGKIVGSNANVHAAGPFSEGRLCASDLGNRAENTELKAGYLDRGAAWIIPPKFRKARSFHEGVAVATVSYGALAYSEGLIDLNGSWIVEPRFEAVSDFGPNMSVTLAKEKFGPRGDCRSFLIDKKGGMVGKKYFEGGRGGREGLVPVVRDKKFGCVNEQGDLIIPFSFEDMSYFSEGLAAARAGRDGVGVVDTSGHWVVHPTFVLIGNFSNGVAPAKIKEAGIYKWGYIDRKGDWVIKPKFEEAFEFVEGIAQVVPLGVDPDDVEQNYINIDGERVWPPKA